VIQAAQLVTFKLAVFLCPYVLFIRRVRVPIGYLFWPC
jgi:hypothetical protein